MEGVEPYQQLLDSIWAIQAACAAAYEAVDLNMLMEACSMAEQIGYPHQDYIDTATLRDIVYGLTEEIKEQLTVIPEREQMQELYERCVAVNLNTDQTNSLKTLIDLSEELLCKEQMKAAVGIGDKDRVFLKHTQLKDIFFAAFGDSFKWEQFKLLKTPVDYSKAKLFGKDKLKLSFLVWTKESIPTSLTVIEPIMVDDKEYSFTKDCTKIFKNILGWCGEKQNAYPAVLVQDIITKGLAHVQIRNEIYCQILKQLTSNPNEESKRKLWQLMNILLKFFVPVEFENHLEMYIRKIGGDQYWYITEALHQTAFKGGITIAPTPEDILQEAAKTYGPRQEVKDKKYGLKTNKTTIERAPNLRNRALPQVPPPQ